MEINRKAVENDVEMIIMGSKGNSDDMKSIFFGSTTERVLRFIKRPVLCVPPGIQLQPGMKSPSSTGRFSELWPETSEDEPAKPFRVRDFLWLYDEGKTERMIEMRIKSSRVERQTISRIQCGAGNVFPVYRYLCCVSEGAWGSKAADINGDNDFGCSSDWGDFKCGVIGIILIIQETTRIEPTFFARRTSNMPDNSNEDRLRCIQFKGDESCEGYIGRLA